MIKPKTRKEVFMDAIAKGKKPAIEPLTREEVLMYEHAEREASGGGGGGCVVVTASQNRLYADEDMSEEITSFEEDWLGIIHSGKLVLLYDADDSWHGYLITNVDGRTVNCGHKAFYTNGGNPQ